MSTLSKILYVEDEPDIQHIVKIALETLGGFTLCVCSSGQEAIKNADEFKPDLLLLDVMMPGMDGPTTLQELRKIAATASTPAMFMTAKVQPQEVQAFKEMGAAAVIAKPFDPMNLATYIRDEWNKLQT